MSKNRSTWFKDDPYLFGQNFNCLGYATKYSGKVNADNIGADTIEEIIMIDNTIGNRIRFN